MARLPRIESEGLRLAAKIGRERVSSVVRVTQSWYCERCAVEVYERRCLHCGKLKHEAR